MKKVIYLAGLPRSGSTLLTNLLAMHPEISSTPSSPLCNILQNMRRTWSDDPFLLAQLDSNFDAVHERLKRSTRAFIQAWSEEHDTPVVINKNRGWLGCAEWLREIDPGFKIIVTLRDLRDVYASVEKRHRKTLFMDFPDHMEHNLVDARASNLFADNGIIGGIMKAIQNIGDIPNISPHIYYWRFEDFISDPKKITDHLFEYLGVKEQEIDFDNIIQSTTESDSYYRMKYLHKIQPKIDKPTNHLEEPISPRILRQIETQFQWYFEQFYPDGFTFDQEVANLSASGPIKREPILKNDNMSEDEVMIAQLEQDIKAETS